jgi:hypothetical protein
MVNGERQFQAASGGWVTLKAAKCVLLRSEVLIANGPDSLLRSMTLLPDAQGGQRAVTARIAFAGGVPIFAGCRPAAVHDR